MLFRNSEAGRVFSEPAERADDVAQQRSRRDAHSAQFLPLRQSKAGSLKVPVFNWWKAGGLAPELKDGFYGLAEQSRDAKDILAGVEQFGGEG